MKPLTLLLAASLVTNAALIAVLATRTPSTAVSSHGSGPAGKNIAASTGAGADALRRALASGDVAALEAAGLPPDVARELAMGRIFSRLAERMRAAQPKTNSDGRWWRNRSSPGSREQQLAARRELADALRAAFGDDLGLAPTDIGQLGFLPPEKREALRRVVQDYDEMMAKFGAAGGVQLPSDKEKLRLLKAERDRDIAALLTPEEKLEYEMRTSPSAVTVRNRYGDAIQSEDDFRKIYALQKAFDEQFPPESLTGKISPETLRQRADAQRQLQDEIRAALGAESYAALRRASDGDLRNVDSLVARLNLPSDTTDRVAAARDTFATESQRINADTSLNAQQRRAQLQDLASRARSDLVRTLGSEAGEAYAQSAPWVSMLQSGMAYSTTPQANSPGTLMLRDGAGPSIFPVLPAGANVGGVTRQVISNSSGPSADGAMRTTDHVMTYTTDASTTDSPAPANKQMIIIAPPTNDAPAPQPKP